MELFCSEIRVIILNSSIDNSETRVHIHILYGRHFYEQGNFFGIQLEWENTNLHLFPKYLQQYLLKLNYAQRLIVMFIVHYVNKNRFLIDEYIFCILEYHCDLSSVKQTQISTLITQHRFSAKLFWITVLYEEND